MSESNPLYLDPARKSGTASFAPQTEVTVVDVKMPFTSMVVFMVKWAIAAIPALIILFFIGAFLFGLLGSMAK